MEPADLGKRGFQREERSYDVVVLGGGMAGVAAAVTAARHGARTALVQERPVLGGNASTEIRVNLEGANGGVHNRFFVESGLAEDLLLENFWRNPTGSADHWTALLLELVLAESRIDLYLDTVGRAVETSDDGSVKAIEAFTLASEREWRLEGRFFVDATGDGTIAYLAGAAYMRGEEARSEFDEPLAPPEATDLKLGGTMQFMCKDLGRPVEFEPPTFARKVEAHELRVNRKPNVWMQAPVLGGFWWIEYGGHLDTIGDNEQIKRTLLAEVYGVWDYVKNSPEWRERNANLDLEWVAAMPGKRESRRIVGDYILTEHDVMGAPRFEDAVAFGGWSVDRHAPLGFEDFEVRPCVQIHAPGVYQIPLRALYARDVPNLFLAGRDVSCSHIACCSARVMLTCTTGGEAVGAAAALACELGRTPREIVADPSVIGELRRRLERDGHYVPYVPIESDRLPPGTRVSSSSDGLLEQTDVRESLDLGVPRLVSLPLVESRLDRVRLWVTCDDSVRLAWRLHDRDARGFWTPAGTIASGTAEVPPQPGGAWIALEIGVEGLSPGYVHLALACERGTARLGADPARPLGPLSWRSQVTSLDAEPVDRRATESWSLPQQIEEEWGDSFAFVFSYWRRNDHGWGGPSGPGVAFAVEPSQYPAPAQRVLEPFERPTVEGVHGWASAECEGRVGGCKFVFAEPQWLAVELEEPVDAEWVDVYFNSDLDRHLANLWYCHPPGERAMPPIVADFTFEVLGQDGAWRLVEDVRDNYRRRRRFLLGATIAGFRVTCLATHGERYASVTDLRLKTR